MPLASFDVHLDDPDDASLCAICGRRWSDVAEGREWLNVEITRSDGRDGTDWLVEDFCTQEHAAQWLSRPLPPPASPYTPPPSTWKDRVAEAAFGVALLVALALMLFGAYSLLRSVIPGLG